jgi:hypothetical protein
MSQHTMTDNLTSLYSSWFNAVPQAFRAMVPATGVSAPAASNGVEADTAALPFPSDQIGKALGMLDGMLKQLFESYLPLLSNGGMTAEPLQALAKSAVEAFNGLLASLPNPDANSDAGAPMLASLANVPGMSSMAEAMQPLTALMKGFMPAMPNLQSSLPGANQLQLGIERTFGGLGDAFGLRPMRDLDQAWREMLLASAAKQRAQVEYLALVAKAFSTGTQDLVKELQAMGARGERVESLLAFIRLWAKSIDAPLHETMQGEPGLAVTAKVIRASSKYRQQLQTAVGLASEALHVPTRADMDDAYREIQELKREMRQLKRALPVAAQRKMISAKGKDA